MFLVVLAACSGSGDEQAGDTATSSTTTSSSITTSSSSTTEAAAEPGPDDGHGPDDDQSSDDGQGPDDGHGPDDDPVEVVVPGDIRTVTMPWAQTASEVRDDDEDHTRVICPADGTGHVVWGTDTYSDDSSVCTAAVHIGLLTFDDGGEVLIEHRPGLGFYRGSSRNGVTTREWDSWPGSFVFIGARGVAIEGEPGG